MNVAMDSFRRKVHGVMFKLPGMITCGAFEDFIFAYLEDELPSRQRRLFEVHLMMCRSCRRYLAAYRETIAVTASVADFDHDALANVPEDLVAAVLAARSPPTAH